MASNNNDTPTHTILTSTPEQAELRERVTNQSRRISDIEGEMRSGFNQVNASIQALSNELRSGSKTQWPVIWSAIGVSFAILLAVGSQALSPIKEQLSVLQSSQTESARMTSMALNAMQDKMISRTELDQRSTRTAEDRDRVNSDLKDLRTSTVTRNEWMERNGSRDHEVANLQKQIDLQRIDFQTFASSLGNGRDFITDLKQEVGRLRDQLSDMRARQWQAMRQNPPSTAP